MKKLMMGLALAVLAAGCSLFVEESVPTHELPRLTSHRGGRAEFDDNAVGGFRRSLAGGITRFETDVRLTKDGELVIMHDDDPKRTTTYTGEAKVREMTLAEVTALTLRKSGENVPTMRQVAEVFRGRTDVFVEWELKEAPKGAEGEAYCRKAYETASSVMEPGTYIFIGFNANILATMKRVCPQARTGLTCGGPLTKAFVDKAKAIGCTSVQPGFRGATKAPIDYAHAQGIAVALWMVNGIESWKVARGLGADAVTTDCPLELLAKINAATDLPAWGAVDTIRTYRDYVRAYATGQEPDLATLPDDLRKKATARRRLVCLDLDATLCQHRSPVPEANFKALKELMKRYKCVMVGAGNAPRIHRQMGNFPIDVIGNYGMQEYLGEDGNFRCVRAVTNTVDRQFFREKTDYLRRKYGYTKYEGESLEFHASGMVTFGLLGTSPEQEHKIRFDPDRRKRRAMYPEVCRIFKDYSVYIGGSTSFDFAGPEYNKYDAVMNYAKRHGYALDEIVFVGDDFGDGGGDSHVRIKGMDYIEIEDYRDFPRMVSVLLK